jgi:hypothetical protein
MKEQIAMTVITSRRAILAGLAAAPVALAAPAFATGSAFSGPASGKCSFPELAVRYRAIFDRWKDRTARDRVKSHYL